MKVLHLISSGGYYGAESMVVGLAAALGKIGCTCRLGVFANAHAYNAEVAAKAALQSVPVTLVLCKGKVDRNAVQTIRKLILDEQVDIVHTHGYKGDIYGWFAARNTQAKLLATCHNWTRATLPLYIYSMLDLLALRQFPRIVAVADNVYRELTRAGARPERTTVVSNGIDVSRFMNVRATLRDEFQTGDRPLVGFVGRLSQEKAPEQLLRTAPAVLQACPDAMFFFVGEGRELQSLTELAKSLRVEHNVVFTGKRDDMPNVYASLDVMVLPSKTEGLPMTVLEAQAAGRVVVASNVGAVPKAVKHEVTGILVAPGDTPGLQRALIKLLQDPGLRRQMGERGRQHVQEHYSDVAMARTYLELYEQMLMKEHVALV